MMSSRFEDKENDDDRRRKQLMTEAIEIIEGCCSKSKKSKEINVSVKADIGVELRMPVQ
jgi:hypothetical protein